MPRGRKARVATATLPPKGYYTGHLAPLLAVRENRISPAAAHLWVVLRAHAWQDGRCDLSDRELGAWMGGLGVRQIYNLRAELARAGLLAAVKVEGTGSRWLAPLPRIERKSVSAESDFSGNGPVKEEEKVIHIVQQASPPPACPVRFTGNPLPPGCEPAVVDADPSAVAPGDAVALARFLAERGAFPSVAAALAPDLLARLALPEAQVHSLAVLTAIERSPDVRNGRIGGEDVLRRWVSRLRSGAQPPAWAVEEARQALGAGISCRAGDRGSGGGSAEEDGDGRSGEAPDEQGDAEDCEPAGAGEGAGAAWGDGGEDEEERPWIVAMGRACSHRELWDVALTYLRLQLPGSTFDNWLAGSLCTGVDGPGRTLVVQVRDRSAVDWLTLRLRRMVLRTVAGITGQDDLDVRFEEA